MPVRCGTNYSRPYRVIWLDRAGKLRSKAFHWQGPADEWGDWLSRNNYEGVELVRAGKGERTKTALVNSGRMVP